jgi:GAF domain-containing protein
VGQRVPIGEGITGLAARTHEVQIGAPLYDGVRQAERGEAPAGDPRSVIAAPMLVDDVLVGVITAVSFDPALRFRQEHATLYARAAAVAAVVVDQHRRLEALEAGAAAQEDREGLEERVIEGVRRLVRRREQLPELARLVAALEALTAGNG